MSARPPHARPAGDRSAPTRSAGPTRAAGPSRAPRRDPRLTPTRLTLAIALVGSVVFGLYALTVRDASQIPLLATGAFVLGIVFSALAVAAAVGIYRAAAEEREASAFAKALGGGLAALIAFGCFAVAAVLALLWGG